ncbi:MAG: hypothetical protein ACRDMZ_09920 [Solirubrobacteraceae bacterium]
MAVTEPEILMGRRAFPTAQQLLAGVPLRRLPALVEVGWYGTETHSETGAFAVVRSGWGLDDLLGEVLKVTVGRRSVFVYVIGARGVPTDIALARRAFFEVGRLSHETLPAVVEVVE